MANDTVFAPRYAQAFASVAVKQGLDLTQARQQMAEFADTFKSSGPLREVLMDPSIPSEQKLSVLDGMAGQMNMGGAVRNFLAVIMDHQRLASLGEILAAYDDIADAGQGVTEAEVLSVRELEGADRAQLEQQIARLAGTKVRISYRLDASLLGGAVVRIGSTVYDGSVRTQLEQMKTALTSA